MFSTYIYLDTHLFVWIKDFHGIAIARFFYFDEFLWDNEQVASTSSCFA
jgi:hypothetical protein